MPNPHPNEDGRLWAQLRFAAWLSIAVHGIAGLAMALILRHGLVGNSDVLQRLQFITENRGSWIGAWLTWNVAALSILYFYAAFARAHRSDGQSSRGVMNFAVLVSVAAVAVDLAAEAIEIGVLPGLALEVLMDDTKQASDASLHVFLVVDRIAVMMTGFLANGLYTVAAVLLVWSSMHAYPKWIWTAGFAVGLSGCGLSVAALLDSVPGMIWSNVVLLPCLLIWQLGVAVTAGRRR